MNEIIVYRNPLEKMLWDFWLSPGWYNLPWFFWGVMGLGGIFVIAFVCHMFKSWNYRRGRF